MLSISLFAGLVVCLEMGFRFGRSRSHSIPESAHEGIGVIEAAVFALLGLLLALSFSGGASRLDVRRQLIVQEANAIGTAYLRIDLLPASDQPEMRRLFRDYLDARLSAYGNISNLDAATREFARAVQIQQHIWTLAVAGCRDDPTQNAARLLLPALNEMIDVTTSRAIALRTHLPSLIIALLVVVTLLSGLLAGYAMAKCQQRSWLHVLVYAATVALTVYTILDLDYPRFGLIRLEGADSAMHQLRDSIR